MNALGLLLSSEGDETKVESPLGNSRRHYDLQARQKKDMSSKSGSHIVIFYTTMKTINFWNRD